MAYRSLIDRINEPIEAIKSFVYHALVFLEGWIVEQERPFSALLHRNGELIHPVLLEELGFDTRRIIRGRYCWIVVVNVG